MPEDLVDERDAADVPRESAAMQSVPAREPRDPGLCRCGTGKACENWADGEDGLCTGCRGDALYCAPSVSRYGVGI